ncbi:lipoate--protein ligase [Furfurilactobacillus rossiae]|uniref:lipoate--protein ligase n=1 Tax=Furfurilactobacillus rossiae DSM 15814 TaxID=1114972 RepID=A0A0R1RGI4_9LACO|nr:lipoate--protein ligase [Furfurilactobacillus rossiae]KRL53317.1 lipoyltransferase and lipoate-protein ligase [Furfurilactobacillus rossiae DSM 15814]QFR67488.1 lipoate--protein ligase [Furfurilactobacillus rossiae]QLE60439.1 Lipoate-protein ligase A [Furfurilactobacillus rossiae]
MFLIDVSRNGKPVYDPIVNQSLDNYLVNDLRLPGHGLIVYVNQPSVIVGVHQNAYAEVDLPYLKKKNIKLVRRTSGGGAVYHDFGNIIFENIVIGDTSKFGHFDAFANPILNALHDMGATDAQLRGRNDMVIDGKKFSGMTMFKVGDSYAAGGTLMYNLDLTAASDVLTPEADKLASKGVKSVDSRVTNIMSYLKPEFQNLDIETFRAELLKRLFHVDDVSKIETYHLNDHDWEIIDKRLAGKYDTDAWNYGENPGFDEYRSKHFQIGTVAFNFTLKDNKIADFKTYGDFINGGDPAIVDKAMLDVAYTKDGLTEGLNAGNYKQNIGDIDVNDLVDLILEKE